MSLLDFWKGKTGRQILIYADFIDPFCYMGFHVLRPLAEARKIELIWKGFELNPATPPEGLPLVTGSNSDLRPGMWASVKALAQGHGLDLPEPNYLPNTRMAHALVRLAQKTAVKNPLIDRIYQAYFIGRQDIGKMDVLIELANSFGFTSEHIQAAEAQLAAPLETHRQEAQKLAFLGVPGFVYKGRTYFGALSSAAWEDIFRGGKRRGR